jgi:hypothetical protein
MNQAKRRAAAQGESLNALFTRALACELGKAQHPQGNSSRVKLPLFGDSKAKPVKITPEYIALAEAKDDLVILQRLKRRRS